MTQYVSDEISKVLNALKMEDPTTQSYATLLRNVEYLLGMSGTIDAFLTDMEEIGEPMKWIKLVNTNETTTDNVKMKWFKPANTDETTTEDVKNDDTKAEAVADAVENNAKEEVSEADIPDVDTVKDRLVEDRRKYKLNIVKIIKENFGVGSFSELPKKKYPDLMRLLDEIEANGGVVS